MVSSISLLSSTTLLTKWASQFSSQSSISPRDSTWQCVCFRNQKRKPMLYLIPARHFLSAPIDSITSSIHATSGVSEVQRSTSSNNVNEMKEFEMELQELFNEVKAMVKMGKERDAMDLLRANYVAVKEEMDSGLKGFEQAAVLDIIALGYMAVGDVKPVRALLDMINKVVDNLEDSEPLLDSVLMHAGSMYSAIGRFENAILAQQRAVRILENRYGNCNTLLVSPLLGLAKSFASDGKASKAVGVYERTVTILERDRGSESEDLVVPLFSLGKLLLKEGKAAEAEIPFTRIIKIYKKIYGEKDGRVGMAMCSLANAKCSKGDANEAVDIYKNALRIIKDSNYMAIDNSILENMRIDLAELLHFVGRGEEGRELLEECLLINERFKGKNHPSMATHLINLAASYSRSKNYVEAERLLRTCLDIMEKSVGSEDQSITFPMLNLAVTLSQLNRDEEAEQIAIKVLRIREKAFGKESLPVGEALDCLVSIQARLGRDEGELLELLKRVMMIQEKEFGPSAQELIVTLQKIVHFLDKLEMKDEKFKFRRRLALIRER
ncbi:PREDICTED: nephrocystin-3-like [Camelina sativa]|uniref:Nephrocystin-3-like n=1 Tax=Camelina sativa TaxID=90675 RepID=A0ABM0USG9_CAMSA|nr:PREDICTED: nephrocystin-3-like [Camelina sativa]